MSLPYRLVPYLRSSLESIRSHQLDVRPGDGQDGGGAPGSSGHGAKALVWLRPRYVGDGVSGQVGSQVSLTARRDRIASNR